MRPGCHATPPVVVVVASMFVPAAAAPSYVAPPISPSYVEAVVLPPVLGPVMAPSTPIVIGTMAAKSERLRVMLALPTRVRVKVGAIV
jgi:hypothetical protein